jgi:hypothetical protein
VVAASVVTALQRDVFGIRRAGDRRPRRHTVAPQA